MCDKFHTTSLATHHPRQSVRYPFESFFDQFNLVRLTKCVRLTPSDHTVATYLD